MFILNNVGKIYHTAMGNDIVALHDLSCTFLDSGLNIVCGRSGCGKTTLLNILGCIDDPSSGNFKISFDKKEISQKDYFENWVSFIHQDYNLIPELNVKDNIRIAVQLQGKYISDEEISNILKKVDLDHFEDRKISELSGGQQQRIAIARALSRKSRVILADEPTGNLDTETAESIFELLKTLSKDTLIIVVTHDRDFAEQYGDRILYLKNGTVEKDEYKAKSYPLQIKNDLPARHKNIKFKYLFKFSRTLIKKRIVSFIFACLLFTIAISLLGTTISSVSLNLNQIIANGMQENDIDYVNVTNNPKRYLDGQKFLPTEYSECEKLFSNITKIYTDFEIDISEHFAQIDSNQKLFFLSSNRINRFCVNEKLKLNCGSKPESADDIVLSYYIAEHFMQYGYEDQQIEKKSIIRQIY